MKACMFSCIKHACFHVFSPFSAHDIIVEKGPFYDILLKLMYTRSPSLLSSSSAMVWAVTRS